MGIFAKFIFAAAHVFTPGVPDLPPLVQVSLGTPEVYQAVATFETLEQPPCSPASTECPGPIFTIRARPLFCTQAGVYTVTARLGLIAQEAAGGKVWVVDPSGAQTLLAAFNAAPGAPAYVSASLPVLSAYGPSCYAIRVEANRPVEVIADPAVSFLTISR